MKPAPFDYSAATSSADARQQLVAGGGAAKILAGGQSLGPMLNLRLARPGQLVDLSRAGDLRSVTDEGDTLLYGAALRHAEFEDGDVADATPGWLPAIARGIAYRAVRNRGTIGGSLAHADPAADWVVTLTALGAEVVIAGPDGAKTLPMTDFIRGPLSTALEPADVLTGIRLRKRLPGARWGYWKFAQKAGEFAKASAAVLIDAERGETRIVVGAIERAPIVLDDPQAALADPETVLPLLKRLTAPNPPATLALHAAAVRRACLAATAPKDEDMPS
ncbi:FAD binding domain-containing protein [Jiella avicenniae]|uniref:FAD binding domain-containing protein n=1 Tax=Jiella avicenniae TaxID=2907202 RepID=A0A9X1P1P4_9HYPH|nr:FAD binding domain-containing protein [Jiella avicenniae]MCE7027723.1 FAD binding domain-containing protein [Jiella avicenniae]MCE7028765.1 FAD binding domain-containing protein [Jiella avicenniae]